LVSQPVLVQGVVYLQMAMVKFEPDTAEEPARFGVPMLWVGWVDALGGESVLGEVYFAHHLPDGLL
jgi:hypothetical protein